MKSLLTVTDCSTLLSAPLKKKRVTFTQADIERQLDKGAFLMKREEAVAAGFLNPYDEQDAVIVDIREERK